MCVYVAWTPSSFSARAQVPMAYSRKDVWIAVITVEPAVQRFPCESTWKWGVWVMINRNSTGKHTSKRLFLRRRACSNVQWCLSSPYNKSFSQWISRFELIWFGAKHCTVYFGSHDSLPRMVRHNFQKYPLTPPILRRGAGAKICSRNNFF